MSSSLRQPSSAAWPWFCGREPSRAPIKSIVARLAIIRFGFDAKDEWSLCACDTKDESPAWQSMPIMVAAASSTGFRER